MYSDVPDTVVWTEVKPTQSQYIYGGLQFVTPHVDERGRFAAVFPIPSTYARRRYYVCAASLAYDRFCFAFRVV